MWKDEHSKVPSDKPLVRSEIGGEVILVENLNDLSRAREEKVKLEQNIFIICNQGHLELEIGAQTIELKAGQMCVLPSSKTVSGTSTHENVLTSVLAISDRVLRSVLGPQASIWNNAMYLRRAHIIDGEWSYGLRY